MSSHHHSSRIIGIDIARAIAVIGMVIVNYKIVFGADGSPLIKSFAGIFEGKASALFVVLAGLGISLGIKKAIATDNLQQLKTFKWRLIKRAILLFLLGVSYLVIWPADILHYYGVYILVLIFLLRKSNKTLILSGFSLIAIYPILMLVWSYEEGWDFTTLNYIDFNTIKGFTRNLFYNGFHPVIPWSAFIIFGYWLGRQDLRNRSYVKKLLFHSSLTFIFIQLFSFAMIHFIFDESEQMQEEMTSLLGTSPMPPLPIYMLNGVSIAFATIAACILLGEKFKDNSLLVSLNKTGRLALTFYVAHVILGMGVIELLNPGMFGNYPVEFSVGYALVFSMLCIVFSSIWLKYFKQGPLEWVFRKLVK